MQHLLGSMLRLTASRASLSLLLFRQASTCGGVLIRSTKSRIHSSSDFSNLFSTSTQDFAAFAGIWPENSFDIFSKDLGILKQFYLLWFHSRLHAPLKIFSINIALISDHSTPLVAIFFCCHLSQCRIFSPDICKACNWSDSAESCSPPYQICTWTKWRFCRLSRFSQESRIEEESGESDKSEESDESESEEM